MTDLTQEGHLWKTSPSKEITDFCPGDLVMTYLHYGRKDEAQGLILDKVKHINRSSGKIAWTYSLLLNDKIVNRKSCTLERIVV